MNSRGRLILSLIKSDGTENATTNKNVQIRSTHTSQNNTKNTMDVQQFFEIGPYLTPAVEAVPVIWKDEYLNQYPYQNSDSVLTPLAAVNPHVYIPDFTLRQNSTSNMSLDNLSGALSFANFEPNLFHDIVPPLDPPIDLHEVVNVHPVSISSTNHNPSSVSESPLLQNESQFIIPDSSPTSALMWPQNESQNSPSQATPDFVSFVDPDNPMKLSIRKISFRNFNASEPISETRSPEFRHTYNLDFDSEYNPYFNPEEKGSSLSSPESSASVKSNKTNETSAASFSHGTDDVTPKRTRKKNSNPLKWAVNKAKIRRNLGKSYISMSKPKKRIQPRKLRSPCGLKCRHRCFEKISKEKRKEIFSNYWALGDVTKQRCFIAANLQSIQPQCKSVERARKVNQAYHFDVGNDRIRVCKKFFCATLDINSRVIRTVLEKKSNPVSLSTDFRGKHKNHRIVPDEIKQDVRNHIESIPRIESHYLRAQTTREFIDGGRTLTDIHKDYVDNCTKSGCPYANLQMFSKIFNEEYNLGFFVPKKDQCELCVAFENAEGEEKEDMREKYDTHQNEKTLSRLEKNQDKEKAGQNYLVAIYDLQAVLPVPRGNVSVFYYKSKLNSYNFSISKLKPSETHCYLWHEGEGNRGAEEIASCVFKYIELTMTCREVSGITDGIDIVFYSDNCCGQQKNKFMIATYIYAVKKFEKINSISHKYLITGHTQNEGDNVHSVIEKQIKRRLRSGPIYIPDQYAELIQIAKKTGDPYVVHQLDHSQFLAIKQMTSDLALKFDQIRISSIKAWKIERSCPEVFQFKTSFSQESYERVDLAKKRKVTRKSNNKIKLKETVLPKFRSLYKKPIPVKEKKKEDLLSLVSSNHIPSIFGPVFKNLL